MPAGGGPRNDGDPALEGTLRLFEAPRLWGSLVRALPVHCYRWCVVSPRLEPATKVATMLTAHRIVVRFFAADGAGGTCHSSLLRGALNRPASSEPRLVSLDA